MKTPQSKLYFVVTLLLILFVNPGTYGQANKTQEGTLKPLAHLPQVLHESSGLAYTKSGKLWTIIDSKLPILYNINTVGEIQRFIYLNHKNLDWEDMTQDDQGNFYIGNFGNNGNKRRDLKIIKVSPPDSIKSDTLNLSPINGGVIKFRYPDQKLFPPPANNLEFDMEAMIAFGNSLYLFSKNRTKPFTGYTKMYKLPNTPGDYVAELIDSVNLGPGFMLDTWVTGADISPDKKILALLSHDKVWFFYCFEGDRFFSGKKQIIPLGNFSQKEGICFVTNTKLYITDELTKNILGGNLYELTINKDYGKQECK
jgi:hypothetical protein